MLTNGQITSVSLIGFSNRQMLMEKAASDRRRTIKLLQTRAASNSVSSADTDMDTTILTGTLEDNAPVCSLSK